ncbi:AMP-binding protein [Rhodococcus erythropolis]|uniref:AMP-binding protein n=1 Tax=Rhodococcus sp. TaxID=1831 RepID=UPI001A2402ED|nr:AMP-binding protein [Rhodococcus sp. (in: high G+C Gram-positive bacteria)]MBJ7477583.1 AMP-binding protein [Rhodococcus sp. (in: high G+C Gram-positive bacteria)]
MPRDTHAVPRSLPELIRKRAVERPEHPALVVDGITVTYRELRHRAASMGADLRNHGVSRGERVAALSGNRIELADLVLGCAWIGAVVVPLNTALRADSVASALEQAGVQRILVSPEYSVAVTGFDGTVWVMGEQYVPTAGSHPGCEPETLDPLDLAAILFTSGTTGLPRGVRCPHAQFLQWGKGVSASLGLTADDVLYNCLPLFHTNALNTFVQSLWAGSTFVLGQHFSVRNHWHEVRRIGATVDYLLGAMVAMLMNADPSSQDREHSVRVALAPATPTHLIEPFAQRFGVELVDGFGSTETNLVIGTLPGNRRAGYMGMVMSGYEAVVVDNGTAVADGEPGELVVRTTVAGACSQGYLGDPIPEPGSWIHTGDRVIREEGGWFRFVDRIKDVIRRRGENISGAEVEAVLALHPSVSQVAVFPVPSDLAEDDVMATVILRPGRDFDPTSILDFSQIHLPYFALPRYIDVVESLPLTETGKVQKAVLRARGVGSQTWDCEKSEFRARR